MKIEINIPEPKFKIGELVLFIDYNDIVEITDCLFTFYTTYINKNELLSSNASCDGRWIYRINGNGQWLHDEDMSKTE